jgi:hypothetical protein
LYSGNLQSQRRCACYFAYFPFEVMAASSPGFDTLRHRRGRPLGDFQHPTQPLDVDVLPRRGEKENGLKPNVHGQMALFK